MPLYDFTCAQCDNTRERYMPHGSDEEPLCETCASALTRSVVGLFKVRAPRPTGATMADGTFVKGTWGSPPRRVRRRIKTFT